MVPNTCPPATSSRLCWWQCGQVGTLLHMWWSCPLLSSLWSVITDLLFALTNYHLTLSPELAILDILLYNVPHHFRTITHHTRITIARHWKEQISPSLNFSCHNELTLTPFNPSPSKKIDFWSYWIESKYYT